MSEQLVNLETLNKEILMEILKKYFIEYEIDSDGDIFIENPARLYIEINKEKEVMRMYGFIHYIDYPNAALIPDIIDRVNKSSYTLSYMIMNNKSIFCEYKTYLFGKTDERGIIRSIKKTESEIINMKDLILHARELKED